MPKSTTGDILDHIQGRDSKYISLSLTKGGTARFHGPDGIAEIDLDMALKTGSGLVSHTQVLQVARKHGTTKCYGPNYRRNFGRIVTVEISA